MKISYTMNKKIIDKYSQEDNFEIRNKNILIYFQIIKIEIK